jgi:RNA polymerase sigma-70 factor (ECF subfamily)
MVGGVKAALNRGRTKRAALPAEAFVAPERERDPELLKLLHRYVELFNRRAVRESLRKDQRLSKTSPKRVVSGTGRISSAH